MGSREQMQFRGWVWAIAAGANASMAAVSAKLAASPQVHWVTKVASYGFVLVFNVVMWSCYVKSLKALTSLHATVVNFSANFLLSGLAGYLCFNESLSLRWFMGAFLIMLGILFIGKADNERLEKAKTS